MRRIIRKHLFILISGGICAGVMGQEGAPCFTLSFPDAPIVNQGEGLATLISAPHLSSHLLIYSYAVAPTTNDPGFVWEFLIHTRAVAGDALPAVAHPCSAFVFQLDPGQYENIYPVPFSLSLPVSGPLRWYALTLDRFSLTPSMPVLATHILEWEPMQNRWKWYGFSHFTSPYPGILVRLWWEDTSAGSPPIPGYILAGHSMGSPTFTEVMSPVNPMLWIQTFRYSSLDSLAISSIQGLYLVDPGTGDTLIPDPWTASPIPETESFWLGGALIHTPPSLNRPFRVWLARVRFSPSPQILSSWTLSDVADSFLTGWGGITQVVAHPTDSLKVFVLMGTSEGGIFTQRIIGRFYVGLLDVSGPLPQWIWVRSVAEQTGSLHPGFMVYFKWAKLFLHNQRLWLVLTTSRTTLHLFELDISSGNILSVWKTTDPLAEQDPSQNSYVFSPVIFQYSSTQDRLQVGWFVNRTDTGRGVSFRATVPGAITTGPGCISWTKTLPDSSLLFSATGPTPWISSFTEVWIPISPDVFTLDTIGVFSGDSLFACTSQIDTLEGIWTAISVSEDLKPSSSPVHLTFSGACGMQGWFHGWVLGNVPSSGQLHFWTVNGQSILTLNVPSGKFQKPVRLPGETPVFIGYIPHPGSSPEPRGEIFQWWFPCSRKN